MNHAGESLIGFPVELTTISGNGNGKKQSPSHSLAIVGSHPAGRENIPWDDPNVDIFLFNEAAQKPEKYPRWSMLLQIHGPEVYTSLNNWVNKDHWAWLQQSHGKPIWMQEIDPRVPDSVKYPLDEILRLTPYRYLRSSPAMALALGIYMGYKHIMLFGSELTSNTEYAYQATNYAFWIGFAHGRGINLDLQCWQDEFNQRIYGYDGELQIDREYYSARIAQIEPSWRANENALRKIKTALDTAMLENKYDKVGNLSVEIENAAQAAGETFGILQEAQRYAARTDLISRQEFERGAAQAQKDGDAIRSEKDKEFGKCEYIWNAWRQSGQMAALNQLRKMIDRKTQLAYDCGVKYGVYRENLFYMSEYDSRLQAAGGVRALGKPEEYQVPIRG